MLASELQLMPDKTFFVQLAIFLLVAIGLNYLVFQPVLRILSLRKTRTKGEQEKVRLLNAKTEQMVRDYEKKMQDARVEALKIKEEIRREGEVQGQKMIKEAREASLQEMAKIRQTLDSSKEEAKHALEKEAEVLGKQVAEKLLGRSIL